MISSPKMGYKMKKERKTAWHNINSTSLKKNTDFNTLRLEL